MIKAFLIYKILKIFVTKYQAIKISKKLDNFFNLVFDRL